jgi:UDP-3-O-[3-hydroxymyristoyl] glucosamine N-acyltransferase
MYRLRLCEIWASDIAQYLNATLHGDDVLLTRPQAIRTQPIETPEDRASAISEPWLLLTSEAPAPSIYHYIITAEPHRDMALVLREFYSVPTPVEIHPTAQVDPEAKVGRNVRIGAHSIVEPGVELGDNVWIMNHVVIHGPAIVGKGTVIKDGAVVGSEGYGFVEDESGSLIHVPQLGRTIIGERVWIGSNSTIERAMLADTVVEDEAKIDDLVHIGNGSRIGRRSLITAGCVLAFEVQIGAGAVLAPGVSVRERCQIAPGSLIGQGSVVVENITQSGTYVGVPAKRMRSSR